MVRGMPSQPRAGSPPKRSGFQYGLEGSGQSGGNRRPADGRVPHSEHGRADQLLDLSSLMDGMREHEQREHIDGQHDRNDPAAGANLREGSMDLAAVRAKLQSKTGKQYWRTLEELAGDPEFEELLHREFPRQAPSEWDDAVDRRDFLKLMAASLAFAGLSGCGRTPEQYVVPYVKQPEGMVLGKPQFYATVMPFGADAIGLLVESHEGRPTKIEGNPDHPSSLGATNVFAQASVLNLYDPDRAQTATKFGEIQTWSLFVDSAQAIAAEMKAASGAGFRILTGIVTSHTLAAQIQSLLTLFPQAKWHQWEPAVGDGTREGAKLALGSYLNTVYRPEKADVILSLDSDFLGTGPGHIRYAREFSRRRFLSETPQPNPPADQIFPEMKMNRLYVVEPTPSVTGATADHRLPLRASEVELFARALAAKLGLGGSATIPPEAEKWLDAVAKDLQKHKGATLVVAGEQQPAEVHALAHAINATLGNVGTTLYYTEPVEAHPANHLESLRELCADIDAGKVETLLILGVNPVYTAPHDFHFASKIKFDEKKNRKPVKNTIYVRSHLDETAELCHWHVAESHYLETWGDARAFDGTLSVFQPLIAPLYHTHSAREALAAFGDKPGVSDYEVLRDRLKAAYPSGDFEKFWRKTLNDGLVAGSAFAPASAGLKFSAPSLAAAKTTPADDIEFIFRPDPCVYDGRFANNGWLQELPKPVTKLTWDNALLVSPATARKRGIGHAVPGRRGGEHGEAVTELLEVHYHGEPVKIGDQPLKAPVLVVPGHADDAVTVHLGYGRTRA